jgi:CubicO group peptidase (beta-lactamase class C family)
MKNHFNGAVSFYRNLPFLLLLMGTAACSKDKIPIDDNLYFPPVSSQEWETVTPASLGWNEDKIPALYSLLETNGTKAFILLRDGKIVIEKYFGTNLTGQPFTMSSNWYWASAGKTLTSFIVGKAQEDGFLHLNNMTSDYLGKGWTSLSPSQENKITVLHQLTMTTGLDDGVADNHSFLPADLVYKADAGTRWAYHNGPYTLLEQVVEKSTGESFSEYFNRVLRDKTGMDGSWIWSDNDHVYFSTPRSMARFGLLLLNKGKWASEIILDNPDYYSAMVSTSQNLNKSYGYLWWLNGKESYMVPESQIVIPGVMTPNAPADMISGMGKFGQFVSIVPSEGIVMIRMGENPSSVAVPFLFLDDIWEKLDPVIH